MYFKKKYELWSIIYSEPNKCTECVHGCRTKTTRSNAQPEGDVNMAYGLYVTTTYGRFTFQNIRSYMHIR